MSQIIGSSTGEQPKTPMLKEFYEDSDGFIPEKSYVRIVFLPGKVPNYSLVTDHDFRVNIHRKTPLFSAFSENLAQWIEDGFALAVIPSKDIAGGFAIALEHGLDVEWKESLWGYTCSNFKPKPQSNKVTR